MIRLSKEKRDKLILVAIGTVAVVAGLWLGVIKTRREQIGLSQSKLEKAMENWKKPRRWSVGLRKPKLTWKLRAPSSAQSKRPWRPETCIRGPVF